MLTSGRIHRLVSADADTSLWNKHMRIRTRDDKEYHVPTQEIEA